VSIALCVGYLAVCMSVFLSVCAGPLVCISACLFSPSCLLLVSLCLYLYIGLCFPIHVCVSVCLSVCPSACVYLSVYAFVFLYLSVCASMCRSTAYVELLVTKLGVTAPNLSAEQLHSRVVRWTVNTVREL